MDEQEYTPDSIQLRWSLEFLVLAEDEKQLQTKKNRLRDNLKQWIVDNCEPDENGNHIFEFPKPVIMDTREVRGLVAQRRVSEFVNEDRAFNVAEEYGVLDKVVYEVVTEELDLDALYICNQQGLIPDEAMDSILDVQESYALTQLK